ncbi:MAG: nuclear transport factor 2 family protein [Novosphingobium sp.]
MIADGSLQRLLDERDIERGLARFSRLIDARAWDRLEDVFAADLSFDYGAEGEQHGIAALRATMSRYLDGSGATQHLIGNLDVQIDGDRAVSWTYVQARHQRGGDVAGPTFDSNGEYVDTWARRAAGWRIVRREARWAIHSGDPLILGVESTELGRSPGRNHGV